MARPRIEPDRSYAAMVKVWLAWSLALEDLIRKEKDEALWLFATQAEFKSAAQSGLAYFRKNKPNDKWLHSLHKAVLKSISSWERFLGNRLKRSTSRILTRAQLMMDLADLMRNRERLVRAVVDLGEPRAQQLLGKSLTAAAAHAFELPWDKQSLGWQELMGIAEEVGDQIDVQWEALWGKIAPHK